MMLLFDLNHVAYRCLFSAQKDIKDIGWQYFKHIMYNHIIALARRFDADEIYLMVDSKENWRKKIYPEYKATRKEKREAHDDIDWNQFFNAFNEFVVETKKVFPFYVLQVKYMEADDIAGVIARELQHKKKIVVTSDGDYLQLLKYKNIDIFDPIKNKFLKCDDPAKFLKIKCLMGDKGDNVTAVKARVGEKTAENLVDDPVKWAALFEDATVSYTKPDGTPVTLGQEAKEKLKLNVALMDLSKTPESLVKALKNAIKDYDLPTGKEVFQFLSSNKYRDLVRRMEELDQVIGKIKKFREQNTTPAFVESLFEA